MLFHLEDVRASPKSRKRVLDSSNHSSKLDTLVNQDDYATPIRSHVCGTTDFSKSRGLLPNVPSFAPPPPTSSNFALAPIYGQSGCGKVLCTGMLAKQANLLIVSSTSTVLRAWFMFLFLSYCFLSQSH